MTAAETPWSSGDLPDPWVMRPWDGGYCPQHGIWYEAGCIGCPPSPSVLRYMPGRSNDEEPRRA